MSVVKYLYVGIKSCAVWFNLLILFWILYRLQHQSKWYVLC